MLTALSYYPKTSAIMFALAFPIAMGIAYLDVQAEIRGRSDLPGKTQARAVEYMEGQNATSGCE